MPDIWDIAAITAKFGLYLGVLTASGTVFAAAMFQLKRYRMIAVIHAVIGIVAAVVAFMLGGAMLTGDASGMTDPTMLALLWSTPVGTALAYRMAGLGLLIIGLMFRTGGIWIACVGGLLALMSFVQVGHVPGRDDVLLSAALILHLGAVAIWVGILTPLGRLARTPDAMVAAASLGHKFGQFAAVAVPLLIVAGVLMTYRLVGSVSAMVSTDYGQALILKIVIVGGLLALAALNKLRFIPEMMAHREAGAANLSRSIRLEWGLVVMVFLTTAVLTSTLTLPT